MMRLLFTAFGISLLGTLPLGVLNVTAAQLAVTEGIMPAVCFSLGALVVEMGYVRLTLAAMDWVSSRGRLFRKLKWLTVACLALMAAGCFWSAFRSAAGGVGALTAASGGVLACFLSGAVLSAVNPAQIPFWFGWSQVLSSRGLLSPSLRRYSLYIGGIGLGTFAGNGLFIACGHFLAPVLRAAGNLVNLAIGIVFAIGAVCVFLRLSVKD